MSEKPKVRPKIVWCDPCTKQGWCMIEEVPYECMCGHLRRVSSGMPPFIRQATVAREHVTLPVITQSRTNLFIEASWSDMRAVVKILMMTGTNGHVSIVDENELLAAYVGSMSKASKSADYSGVIYNNISELVSSPDLVILRLNTLSNKNKAAAGTVIEAVKVRVDYGKSTWLLCDLDRPLTHSSFSYSDELIEIVAANFKRTAIPRINKRDDDVVRDFMSSLSMLAPEPDAPQQAPAPRTRKLGHDPEAEPERKPRKKREEEGEAQPELAAHWGGGIKPSKTQFRKS